MSRSKTYSYTYDQYEDEGKNASTMTGDILADPEFPQLDEVIIGSWGGAWEEEGCQPILDGIISHAEDFSHVRHLFIGDMDYEECEVSWIVQGNYEKLWAALPNLKELTIKGATELTLGNVDHPGLEALTIICGGLPSSVLKELQNARLPRLQKLLLYIGSDCYGFDGNAETIKEFLEQSHFPALTYLGIADSEIQDELAEAVLSCKYMGQLETLDLSCGTLTDQGGQLILDALPHFPNIRTLDLHYNYLSGEMIQKLQALPISADLSDSQEPEEYDGEIWRNAMLTE